MFKKNNTSEKKTEKQSKKSMIIGIIALIVIIGTVLGMGDEEKTSNNDKKAKRTESTTTKKSTADSLNSLLDGENDIKPQVTFDKKKGSCKVTFEDERFWDESDFVSTNITRYIDFCKKAYDLKGVKSVRFSIYTSMQDMKGNKDVDKVLTMDMDKSTFKTYKWHNLKFQSDAISNAIDSGDFTIFELHPGIAKKVKWSKVYYKGKE